MYLSIGKAAVIPEETIIGIFDLDICSRSYLTREFLAAAEKKGKVENTAEDIPNSFLLCTDTDKEESRVILSQSTSRTLYKRVKQTEEERRTTWRNTVN